MIRALGVLCATIVWTAAAAHAQPSVTGTWRVDGDGQQPFPWEVVLRTNGATVTGRVSNCFGDPEVRDGRVSGNTVSFTCGRDGNHTIAFVGDLRGNEIVLTWSLDLLPGAIPPNPTNARLFGPSAPRRITARRVPDGDLAALADAARGMEWAGAVNMPEADVKAEGRLFVPVGAQQVRSLIVIMDWGLGPTLYENLRIRRLGQETQSALLLLRLSGIGPSVLANSNRWTYVPFPPLLGELAQRSGHAELTGVPFVVWGHSSGGTAPVVFALAEPSRTLGIVLYHSAGGGPEIPQLPTTTPALIFRPGVFDAPGGPDAFWNRGRAAGAPWALAVEPAAQHMDTTDIEPAHRLLLPWLRAVIRDRRPADPGTAVRPVDASSGWLADLRTGEIGPYASFTGSKVTASWVPDEASADGLRLVAESRTAPGK